jgi:hypothetical protein
MPHRGVVLRRRTRLGSTHSAPSRPLRPVKLTTFTHGRITSGAGARWQLTTGDEVIDGALQLSQGHAVEHICGRIKCATGSTGTRRGCLPAQLRTPSPDESMQKRLSERFTAARLSGRWTPYLQWCPRLGRRQRCRRKPRNARTGRRSRRSRRSCKRWAPRRVRSVHPEGSHRQPVRLMVPSFVVRIRILVPSWSG